MNEPKSGQRFDLTASLEQMVENPEGEFALAADLDAALDLLQRWKNRRTHASRKFQLWSDTTSFLKQQRPA